MPGDEAPQQPTVMISTTAEGDGTNLLLVLSNTSETQSDKH